MNVIQNFNNNEWRKGLQFKGLLVRSADNLMELVLTNGAKDVKVGFGALMHEGVQSTPSPRKASAIKVGLVRNSFDRESRARHQMRS